jgi:hypothetical protein
MSVEQKSVIFNFQNPLNYLIIKRAMWHALWIDSAKILELVVALQLAEVKEIKMTMFH